MENQDPSQPNRLPEAPVAPDIQANKPELKFDKSYVFRIRRIIEHPSFQGLWEVTMLDPKEALHLKAIETIDDANALNFALENLQGRMEEEGL